MNRLNTHNMPRTTIHFSPDTTYEMRDTRYEIRNVMQNEPNLVRLRRIQNPLSGKGLRKYSPSGSPQKRTQTNPNEPKTNPKRTQFFAPQGLPKPKRTQTNPTCRGEASSEAGTNPTCRGEASSEAGTNPTCRGEASSEAGTNPIYARPGKGAELVHERFSKFAGFTRRLFGGAGGFCRAGLTGSLFRLYFGGL
jgi:hypothetical protein